MGLRRLPSVRFLFTGCLLLQSLLCVSQSSVLQSGSWYKLGIPTRGVYRISFDEYKNMGLPTNIDPAKIRIYGNAGGMLPQANNASRPEDLQEISIHIVGGSDGVFDRGDYILFFAEGPAKIFYDQSREIFSYQNNLYSNANYYFITASTEVGKRAIIDTGMTGSYPVVDQYEDFVYHEADEYNDLESGREWFGERYDLTTTYAYRFDIQGIVDNSTIKMVSDVMAQSFNGSSFRLSFNRTPVGEQIVPVIVNTQYGIKGRHKRDTLSFISGSVGAPAATTQEVLYEYVKSSSGRNIGFLDFLLISFKRKLALYGDQTSFRSTGSLNQNVTTFSINGMQEGNMIWDVTDPSGIRIQSLQFNGSTATFSSSSETLREYVVFNDNVPSPDFIGSVQNQNLHGFSPVQFIVVAHPSLLAEAERLAAHRQSNNGWTSVVVTPEQIYNEFSSGRQDVVAIRDFVKYMYDKDPAVLKALLVIGKGSYDYKDRIANNTNFVPTYESRNSLSPLETYSSDDFFGFLEDNEGEWSESPVQNHSLDIGVGRLPVKSITEAKNVVDKIISYDNNRSSYGYWRKDILFVADDGSTSDGFSSSHQSQANAMAESIEGITPAFDTKKIFLGTYSKTVMPNGEVIPEVNKEIAQRFNRGSLIINYTGHGSEKLLADEKIFTETDIDELQNKLYPFLVTATCEFGRQDDPAIVSSAELSVIHPSGGAIGLVTTARPVNSPTNFILNQQFYTSLFTRENNRYRTIGEVFRNTKNNSTSGVANRNFSLIGDPSLTLALPANNIVITELKTVSGSDTLKALSTVIVKGEVHDGDGVRMDNFNGIIETTLFDKATESITVGKNDPPFKFKERKNALYHGKASVTAGEFEFQFIVPKSIAYEYGKGKLGLYASDPKNRTDASGSVTDVIIGGSEPEPGTDTMPPQIALFMGDTSFVNGGVTSPMTTLIAKLEDSSGLSISDYGIGTAMVAILDGLETFAISDYYQSEKDDFTTGWVHFPISGLRPGRHSITVKAWDTFNNPAEATIDFVVTDDKVLVIETLGNAPNPFQDETSIFFTHNRSGDDLQVMLYIYSAAGQVVKSYNFEIPESPYYVDLLQINSLADFGKILPGGIYLARLAVRSLTNGSKCERVTKLIVVN